jgi:adenosylhomocysteinase
VARLDDVVGQADFVITTTGNTRIVGVEHLLRLKNKAVVGNIGHFDDEIDLAGLARVAGVEKIEIKPQVHEWRLPSAAGEPDEQDQRSIVVLSEGRLLNLGNATGHPSFVMSASFTNQVLAQIALAQAAERPEGEPAGVERLPKLLDEKVARLHLEALGVDLTELTKEQAEYIDVDVAGPYKPEHYRY